MAKKMRTLFSRRPPSRVRRRAQTSRMWRLISLIKNPAQKHHSNALENPASQIQVLMQYGAKFGDDPFKKVKGLITELIDRLMAEAAAEATEKEYCDEQTAKTEAKTSELESDIASRRPRSTRPLRPQRNSRRK